MILLCELCKSLQTLELVGIVFWVELSGWAGDVVARKGVSSVSREDDSMDRF